jgi:hypothetical protein
VTAITEEGERIFGLQQLASYTVAKSRYGLFMAFIGVIHSGRRLPD